MRMKRRDKKRMALKMKNNDDFSSVQYCHPSFCLLAYTFFYLPFELENRGQADQRDRRCHPR